MMQTQHRVVRVIKTQSGVLSGRISDLLPERPRQTTMVGLTMAYPSRSRIGQAARRGLVWDEYLRDLVKELEGPDPLVLEVGSNIGASMLTMVSARSDLQVVCCEPSERFLPYLLKNVGANDLRGRVEVRKSLVGPPLEHSLHINDTTASVATADYDGHHFVSDQVVVGTPLDSLVDGDRKVSMVKVDTDGYELEVLRTASRILGNDHPTLTLEYSPRLLRSAGGSAEELISLLTDAGYSKADVRHPSGALVTSGHSLTTLIPSPPSDYWDLVLRD